MGSLLVMIMKLLSFLGSLFLALVITDSALSQPPYIRNTFDTNSAPAFDIAGGKFKQTRQTLAYVGGSTNVHVDLSTGNKFKLTLTQNAHIAFTNISDSMAGAIEIVQDATGGRLVSYNTNWAKSTAGLFSGNTTNANAADIVSFESLSSGTAVAVVQTLDIR